MAFQYKIFNTLWADSYRPKVQMTDYPFQYMEEAMAAGVEVLFLKCHVEPDMLVIVD